jgi:nucleotide-binding universal stress UspA family protein
MFEQIVIPVDGSPSGGRTVPIATDLAKRYGAVVTVVHVREHQKFEGEDVDLGPDIGAQELVQAIVEAFQDAGVEAHGVIRHVSPGETPHEIVSVANDIGADLLVMGTRGMSELRSLMLGGVANKVVHLSKCPVMLVH